MAGVASWAHAAIRGLLEGKTVQVRPRGKSMSGKIEDNDLVTIASCNPDELKEGDIVLVQVRQNVYLHLIKIIEHRKAGRFFQIGNNRGGVNGWVGDVAIYGKMIKVEP